MSFSRILRRAPIGPVMPSSGPPWPASTTTRRFVRAREAGRDAVDGGAPMTRSSPRAASNLNRVGARRGRTSATTWSGTRSAPRSTRGAPARGITEAPTRAKGTWSASVIATSNTDTTKRPGPSSRTVTGSAGARRSSRSTRPVVVSTSGVTLSTAPARADTTDGGTAAICRARSASTIIVLAPRAPSRARPRAAARRRACHAASCPWPARP